MLAPAEYQGRSQLGLIFYSLFLRLDVLICTADLSPRVALTATALSLLPLGQPLFLGTLGITTATTAVLLHAPPAVAQDASAVARIAKAITVRIEGATQGSGVLVKKSRKVSYNSTY